MTIYSFSVAGDETEVLLSTLERNRRTFAWKCTGLDEAGIRATLGPSTITLGGLLKHLALCEDHYFTRQLRGEAMPAPWTREAFEADPDWEWHSAAEDSPAELEALWRASVERSRAAVDAALAEAPADGPGAGLGVPVPHSEWSTTPNLRRLVADMVEEYARHTGHADLIRESVDGLVGEGLPSEEDAAE